MRSVRQVHFKHPPLLGAVEHMSPPSTYLVLREALKDGEIG